MLYLERVLFDEASSITKPYTDFMSEDEVSDLLNEHMETPSSRQSGDNSTQAVVHTQQTVQVVIHVAEPSKKPSTPSFGRNQPRGSGKKRATGASEFAVHEDPPGTRSSVKVSLNLEPIPRPGTAVNTAKGIKNSNRHQTMIKCFHDYPKWMKRQLSYSIRG